MQPRHSEEDNKRLFLVMAAMAVILLVWQYVYEFPRQQAEAQRLAEQAARGATQEVMRTETGELVATASAPRDQLLQNSPRLPIETPKLHGSIALKGARFDDLTLVDYRISPDEDSAEVVLLSPAGTVAPSLGEQRGGHTAYADPDGGTYFADFGWLGQNIAVPGPDTQWQAEGTALTPQSPVILSWENGQGLRFELAIAVDENYLFTVTQRVANRGAAPVALTPYALIHRTYPLDESPYYLLHEGGIGVLGGELQELGYDGIRDDGSVRYPGNGGWAGFSDKYWLTALVPEGAFNARFAASRAGDQNRYQADIRRDAAIIPAGGELAGTTRFFAGAKELDLLDAYGEAYNIPLFDRAVDFGVLYFMTRPIFLALQFFHALVGNFGVAILLLTVVIKLALFPLANKSYRAMAAMKEVQPKMKAIQEKYGEDRMRFQQEMMALYKREGVNPASGCLPILIQLPIFFALYKVLFVALEMRHAPFFGWIRDLSAPDPTNIFNLFGLIDWNPPELLHLGLWPLIFVATMVLQQRLQPTPNDKTQAMVMKWMPYMFLFFAARFPAGLVIYWAWNNALSILQQLVITRDARRERREAQAAKGGRKSKKAKTAQP